MTAAADQAIYIRFEDTAAGTRMVARRGYNGPTIARLQWDRKLNAREQIEIHKAVHLGDREET